MKKNINLLISIVSLLITVFVLTFSVSAWYISNKEVQSSVIGSTADDGFSVKLQRGTFDKTSNKWTWTDTNSLAFSNIIPGNAFFFRIVVESSEQKNLKAEFKNVESNLVDGKLFVNSDVGYVGIFDGTDFIPMYKLDSNNKVIIEKSTVSKANEPIKESKTLYDCSQTNAISLVDFKIHNTFLCYTFEGEPTSNVVSGEGKALTESFNFSISGSGEEYCYFALEFNDAASIETIDGVESSNAYFYQKISIGSIFIRSVE